MNLGPAKKTKKHIFGLPGLGYCRQWCWGVGFSLDFIEALKMLENHEKPCFTFFAFLPPYIGVSGSLVSRMRKISMRSIDWYQKFLISWLAARYSTVFCFWGGVPLHKNDLIPSHMPLNEEFLIPIDRSLQDLSFARHERA